jgi:enoyl-CoA hydratase/carnithine racemase
LDLETLRYELAGKVGTVVLSRPERLNAMNRVMFGDLRKVVDHVRTASEIDEVRALVFVGEGAAFSTGGDIDDFGKLRSPDERREYMEDVVAVFEAVEHLPVPTVAAVHGLALGGGCELTLVCDIVIADETAHFGMPEIRVGLFPGIAIARGGRQLSSHWLKYLALTGERVGARTALTAGLVNEVVALGSHAERATTLARSIAGGSPLAIRRAKAIVNAGPVGGYAETISAIPELMATRDHQEGIAAFRAGRDPEFSGE